MGFGPVQPKVVPRDSWAEIPAGIQPRSRGEAGTIRALSREFSPRILWLLKPCSRWLQIKRGADGQRHSGEMPESAQSRLESWNHSGWKSPWRSSGPTINPPPLWSLMTVSPGVTSTQFWTPPGVGTPWTACARAGHPLPWKFFQISNLNLLW